MINAGCAEDLGSRGSRANKVETKGNSQVCRLGDRPDRGGVCSESQQEADPQKKQMLQMLQETVSTRSGGDQPKLDIMMAGSSIHG